MIKDITYDIYWPLGSVDATLQQKQLKEAGLNRIIQHITNEPICFILASRKTNGHELNKQLTKQLGIDLQKLGYGFIRVTGGYPEKQLDGTTKDVIEQSFIVIDNNKRFKKASNFAEEMFELAKEYKQDSILLQDDTHKAAWYDSITREQIGNIKDKLTVTDIEDGFSIIHGKKFSLVEADYTYKNHYKDARSFGYAIEAILLRKRLGLKEIF